MIQKTTGAHITTPLPTVIRILQYACPFQSVTAFLAPPPPTPPGYVLFNWLNISVPTPSFCSAMQARRKQFQSVGASFSVCRKYFENNVLSNSITKLGGQSPSPTSYGPISQCCQILALYFTEYKIYVSIFYFDHKAISL